MDFLGMLIVGALKEFQKYQKNKQPVCGDCGNKILKNEQFCRRCGSNDIVEYWLYKKYPTKAAREQYYRKLMEQKEEEKLKKIKEKEFKQKQKELEKEQRIQEELARIKFLQNNQEKIKKRLLQIQFCENCNAGYSKETNFCGKCGSKTRTLNEKEITYFIEKEKQKKGFLKKKFNINIY